MLSLLCILQLNFTVLSVYIYVLLLISYMYCMFQLKIKKLFLFLAAKKDGALKNKMAASLATVANGIMLQT